MTPAQDVFPFLVGSGRSGTTLLRVMIDSHPTITIAPEAFFPLKAPDAWIGSDGRLDVDRAARALEQEPWFDPWGLAPGVFRSFAEEALPASYEDLIRCLFQTYADAQNKRMYGSKTPQHVLDIGRLSTMFPESRFIHIVRDGRDVALSFLDVHFGPVDLMAAARLWKHRVNRGHAAGVSLGEGRYLETRYEQLVVDPENELRRICAFLDIGYRDDVLRYHERDLREVAGVGSLTYHRNLSKPPTQGLRDWRRQMTRSDVLLFESVAASTLERFGYERADIRASFSEQVWVGARRASSEGRRRARRARRLRGTTMRRLRHG